MKIYTLFQKTVSPQNLLFFICTMLLTTGCSKFPAVEFNTAPLTTVAPVHTEGDTSIIIWKNPGATLDEFNAWKANKHLTSSHLVHVCPFCDSTNPLEVYEGINIRTLIQGGGGTVGGSGCTGKRCGPTGGGDDTAYFCYNLSMDIAYPTGPMDYKPYGLNDPNNPNNGSNPIDLNAVSPNIILSSQNAFPGPMVTVAVFDTGIDSTITKAYCSGLEGSCNPNASRGWNYNYQNANTQDDYPQRHGSAVAKFIVDQVIRYQNQKINIIPIKIHDSTGSSSLYNVLCGFVYASNSNVNIINASFGFYWNDPDNPPLLLGEFIKEYLTKKGILLVAAAGNQNHDEDQFVSLAGIVPVSELRNLNYHPFYPACFSGQTGFDNVIAVTTVSNVSHTVSPMQNYSNWVVDAGINCDVVFNNILSTTGYEFEFYDPLQRLLLNGQQLIISGSSYAAPILTGKIAANYERLVNGMGGNVDKAILFSRMQTMGLLTTDGALSSQVKQGKYGFRFLP